MKLPISQAATVVLSALLVVGGLELTSYAANGHPLLLGRANSETATATVTNNGSGPALSLKSGKKSPPLAVSNGKLVKRLNADSVDGASAKSLRTNARVFSIPGGSTHAYVLKGVKPGLYLASFDIALETAVMGQCYLMDSFSGNYLVLSKSISDGVFAVPAASTEIQLPKGSKLELGCDADIASASFMPRTVAVIPLGTVTHGKLGALN